jgi:hypothetical protein
MCPMISPILSIVSLMGRRSGNLGSSHLMQQKQHTQQAERAASKAIRNQEHQHRILSTAPFPFCCTTDSSCPLNCPPSWDCP